MGTDARPAYRDQRGNGRHRASRDRGGRDHGGGVRLVPARPQQDAPAVRPRPGDGGAPRRADHPLPHGPRGDEPARDPRLVAPGTNRAPAAAGGTRAPSFRQPRNGPRGGDLSMRTAGVIVLALIGGLLAGLLLSEVIGIIGMLAFGT